MLVSKYNSVTAELHHVNLSDVSLAEVPASLLSCAGVDCVSLGLARTRLTPAHLECLLASCETGRCPCSLPSPPLTPLTSLNISNNDLASLPPHTLAQAITGLVRVNLGRTEEISPHLEDIRGNNIYFPQATPS